VFDALASDGREVTTDDSYVTSMTTTVLFVQV